MTHCSSETAIDTTPTHHSDHTHSDESKSHIQTPNDSVKATNDDTRDEVILRNHCSYIFVKF